MQLTPERKKERNTKFTAIWQSIESASFCVTVPALFIILWSKGEKALLPTHFYVGFMMPIPPNFSRRKQARVKELMGGTALPRFYSLHLLFLSHFSFLREAQCSYHSRRKRQQSWAFHAHPKVKRFSQLLLWGQGDFFSREHCISMETPSATESPDLDHHTGSLHEYQRLFPLTLGGSEVVNVISGARLNTKPWNPVVPMLPFPSEQEDYGQCLTSVTQHATEFRKIGSHFTLSQNTGPPI